MQGRPHTYCVRLARGTIRGYEGIPELATFSTRTDLPLPEGAYLALHALCCEVAWMSGAPVYIMDMGNRIEEMDVLAKDGSPADVLTSALTYVQVR